MKTQVRRAYLANDGLDVTFVIQGKEVRAMKFILCVASKVFRTKFQNEWKRNKEWALRIDYKSFKVMKMFIQNLHGVKHESCDYIEKRVGTRTLADHYNVKSIGDLYAGTVSRNVSKDNVINVLTIGLRL